jgi:hypothetical protein
MRRLSKHQPWAPRTSLGVTVMGRLVSREL